MDDRQRGAAQAPERQETPDAGPFAAKLQNEAGEQPLKPLMMMMSEGDVGYCTGDACVMPVRKDRGEVQ